MKMSATVLIPAILVAGCGLGVLAAGEVNTRMKMTDEPSWRVAAREANMRAASFTYADPGPSDLSPQLPWIVTGPDGRVALYPEDIHGAAPYPASGPGYPADWHIEQTAFHGEAPPDSEPAIARAAVRAAETVATLEAVEISDDAIGDEPATVHPAVLDTPMAAPLFAGDPPGHAGDPLGG